MGRGRQGKEEEDEERNGDGDGDGDGDRDGDGDADRDADRDADGGQKHSSFFCPVPRAKSSSRGRQITAGRSIGGEQFYSNGGTVRRLLVVPRDIQYDLTYTAQITAPIHSAEFAGFTLLLSFGLEVKMMKID